MLATCVFLLSECLLSSLNLLIGLTDLRQRRERIKVPGDVRVKDRTVMLRHLQRRVPHELLEGERIATAVHQILSRKGMTEKVDARLLDSAPLVVFRNRLPQSAF